MRVGANIEIGAPRDLVWAYVSDPGRYLHFMQGITRWEVQGDQRIGLGSRYRMLMRVRSAEIGGLIEVVEYTEPSDLAWVSVLGIDQRGRWRLREVNENRTRVEFRLAYGVAGSGVLGYLAENIAAGTVRDNIRRSLQQLKRQVEHEQLRAAAAERRAARAGSA
jgi:uncharacterized membrane protein